MSTLITGATGFIGQRLASALLAEGRDLVVVARGRTTAEARTRVEASLPGVSGNGSRSRLHVCLGHLEAPRLGLSPSDRERILAECDEVIHCGASVRFDMPLEQARAVNVGGTAALLELARERVRRGAQTSFHYVSTAFVAGNRTDVVFEGELDDRLGHKNTYERTKFEAEVEVRRAAAELPVTVYRPSVVVGDSSSGVTAGFNALYWPARVYALGLWRTCPGRADASLDVVPVDFVVDAIMRLRTHPKAAGNSFHLTAGPQGAVTVGQVADLLHLSFPSRKPVRFVDPGPWLRYVQPVLTRIAPGRVRQVLRTGEYYIPYFTGNPHFDNTETQRLLRGSGIEVPSFLRYAEQLFAYCVETDWGRKPQASAKSGSHR